MSIRDPSSGDSPIYDEDSDYLSVRLYHGGTLKWIPHTEYIGGSLTTYDYFDVDTITFGNLYLKVKALGHSGLVSFYFRIPGKCLDTGFVLVKNEEDVTKMKRYGEENNRRIDLYVKHSDEEHYFHPDAYFNICPDDYERADSNGVGDFSDDLDDHDFQDSDYDMSEDDKLFYANVDEGAEWAGRIKEGLGFKKGRAASEEGEDSEGGGSDDSSDFGSIPEVETVDDNNTRNKKFDFPYYKDSDDPEWEVGMIFKDHTELREAIIKNSYKQGRMINFEKSERSRVKAVCQHPCTWFVFASINWDKSFQMKKVGPDHTCSRQQKGLPLINSGFLARKYLNDFRLNPEWKIPAFHKKVIQDLQIDFDAWVLRRAKRKCLKIINGVDGEQYARLWDYRLELLKRNPQSTVEMEFEQGNPGVFKRIYVCLGGVKHGFKLGCRKVVGLDGTHIKNHFKGQLLCAVGVDPNNCMYPIAYAVVEAECRESWEWFMKFLVEDLDMDLGQGWVLINDRQKGLINAVENLALMAEHRFCVRHMHNNFKQKYRGRSLKDKMWACARATNVEAFDKAMEVIKAESDGAFNWLNAVPKQHWTRSHFGTEVKCDILLNNMCESFNKSILFPREQSILVMIEMIRDYLMVRLQKKRAEVWDWDEDSFTPKVMQLIEKYKKWSGGCFAAYAGYNQFVVTTINGSKFAVDLNNSSCGCRRWDISGIPCHHAIASINKVSQKVEDYVDACYKVRNFKRCYSGIVYPMNGEGQWERTGFIIKPPNIKKQPGRPKRKRKQEPIVGPLAFEKDGVKILTRKNQVSLRCGICKTVGHNRLTCPNKNENDGASSTTTKRGRKKKARIEGGSVMNAEGNGDGNAEGNGDGNGEGQGEGNNVAGIEGNGQANGEGNEGNNDGGIQGNGEGNEGNGEGNDEGNGEGHGEGNNGDPMQGDTNTAMEMTVEEDAPVMTQPTQDNDVAVEEKEGEPPIEVAARKIQELRKGKQKLPTVQEQFEEEEPSFELALKKIQELRTITEKQKKMIQDQNWALFISDLRATRLAMEAKALETQVDRIGSDGAKPLEGQVEGADSDGAKTNTKVRQIQPSPVSCVRRSGRLNKPPPLEAQFRNNPDNPLVIDDDDSAKSGKPCKVTKLKSVRAKNDPPTTYCGPSLIGHSQGPQLKEIHTRVGGVNVKAKGFVKNGKAVVTKKALSDALEKAKKSLQNQEKSMEIPDKDSAENP